MDRISKLRRIVNSHSATEVEGLLIDVQTANAFCKVYDGLSKPQNRASLLSLPIKKAVDVCWKLVG